MPPRSTYRPGSFHPPNDVATYRDLNLFEQRLKTIADSLQRRKFRYQLFLGQLLLVIAFLLSEVLLQTNWLSIPYAYLLTYLLPEIYPPEKSSEIRLHPYVASGLLFVSVTTLVLFFASGMYKEKIAYANRYVPHANKALRSFNMFLNVRQPPLGSKFPFTFIFNPLAFFFPRPPTTPQRKTPRSRVPSTSATSPSSLATSPSSVPSQNLDSLSPVTQTLPTTQPLIPTVTLSPIPPTTNPRGELIFSSRVDRSFRESYERYRASFERWQNERERAAQLKTWSGWLQWYILPWHWSFHSIGIGKPPTSPKELPTSPLSRSVSMRKGTPSGSESGSRKASPVPRASGATPPRGHRVSVLSGEKREASRERSRERFIIGDGGNISERRFGIEPSEVDATLSS